MAPHKQHEPEPESEGNTANFTKDGIANWLKGKKIKTNMWTAFIVVMSLVYGIHRLEHWENYLAEIHADCVHVQDLDVYGRELCESNGLPYTPSARRIVTERQTWAAQRAKLLEDAMPAGPNLPE